MDKRQTIAERRRRVGGVRATPPAAAPPAGVDGGKTPAADEVEGKPRRGRHKGGTS